MEQEGKKHACIADAYQRRGGTIPPDWAPPPRQQLKIETELDHWAWAALKHGNIHAARKHARMVMRLKPFSMSSWRLMYCALRGR
jgi:hypothetical protein